MNNLAEALKKEHAELLSLGMSNEEADAYLMQKYPEAEEYLHDNSVSLAIANECLDEQDAKEATARADVENQVVADSALLAENECVGGLSVPDIDKSDQESHIDSKLVYPEFAELDVAIEDNFSQENIIELLDDEYFDEPLDAYIYSVDRKIQKEKERMLSEGMDISQLESHISAKFPTSEMEISEFVRMKSSGMSSSDMESFMFTKFPHCKPLVAYHKLINDVYEEAEHLGSIGIDTEEMYITLSDKFPNASHDVLESVIVHVHERFAEEENLSWEESSDSLGSFDSDDTSISEGKD